MTVHIHARFHLDDPAKRARLTEAIGELVAKVRAEEPDCLQYLWFADGDDYVVRESYRSSEAILFHIQNCGALLGELAGFATLQVDLYGPVSDTLREAAKAFDARIYAAVDGVER